MGLTRKLGMCEYNLLRESGLGTLQSNECLSESTQQFSNCSNRKQEKTFFFPVMLDPSSMLRTLLLPLLNNQLHASHNWIGKVFWKLFLPEWHLLLSIASLPCWSCLLLHGARTVPSLCQLCQRKLLVSQWTFAQNLGTCLEQCCDSVHKFLD